MINVKFNLGLILIQIEINSDFNPNVLHQNDLDKKIGYNKSGSKLINRNSKKCMFAKSTQ